LESKKTKDWATRTPLNIREELSISTKVNK
jgi:hypothetical protein